MAFFKALNLLLIIPIFSLFISGIASYAFSIIPVYWTYHLYDAALKGESVLPIFIMGMVLYLPVLAFFFRQFEKRVFSGLQET